MSKELQPALPGAEEVREEERATPTLGEAGDTFTLTANAPKPRQAGLQFVVPVEFGTKGQR